MISTIFSTIYLLIFLIVWYFTENEYIQIYIDKLKTALNKEHKWYKPIGILIDIFSCFKCLSFFVMLIVTKSLFIALVYSFIANLYLMIFKK